MLINLAISAAFKTKHVAPQWASSASLRDGDLNHSLFALSWSITAAPASLMTSS